MGMGSPFFILEHSTHLRYTVSMTFMEYAYIEGYLTDREWKALPTQGFVAWNRLELEVNMRRSMGAKVRFMPQIDDSTLYSDANPVPHSSSSYEGVPTKCLFLDIK